MRLIKVNYNLCCCRCCCCCCCCCWLLSLHVACGRGTAMSCHRGVKHRHRVVSVINFD